MSGKQIVLQKTSKLTVSWESSLLRNILVCQTLAAKACQIFATSLGELHFKCKKYIIWCQYNRPASPGLFGNWWGRIWITESICRQDMLDVKQGVSYLSPPSCHKWWSKCLAAVACSPHELWCHYRKNPTPFNKKLKHLINLVQFTKGC